MKINVIFRRFWGQNKSAMVWVMKWSIRQGELEQNFHWQLVLAMSFENRNYIDICTFLIFQIKWACQVEEQCRKRKIRYNNNLNIDQTCILQRLLFQGFEYSIAWQLLMLKKLQEYKLSPKNFEKKYLISFQICHISKTKQKTLCSDQYLKTTDIHVLCHSLLALVIWFWYINFKTEISWVINFNFWK